MASSNSGDTTTALAQFSELVDYAQRLTQPAEVVTFSYAGEISDFVRFNDGKIRQAGHVQQTHLQVELAVGQRHISASIPLIGDRQTDGSWLQRALHTLRGLLPEIPEDPYFSLPDPAPDVREIGPDGPLAAEAIVTAIASAAKSLDLVGILASGLVRRAYANTLGQLHWHTSANFNFDFSLYWRQDKAIKGRYAGHGWDEAEFFRRLTQAERQLEWVARKPRQIDRGNYRVLLAPAAVEEIMRLLSWDGFGIAAQRTGRSALYRLIEGREVLSPQIHLTERSDNGFAPPFQGCGFIRPEALNLITSGRHVASLISPRSAMEYKRECNGANAGEKPQGLHLAPGDLSADDALALLDTGLAIGNLWYLNYSDRNAGRMTGTTRFGTFWVENGVVQSPIEPLRFDDSLYRLLGSELIGIGSDAELRPDPGTYGGRSSVCFQLPALVCSQMRFTL